MEENIGRKAGSSFYRSFIDRRLSWSLFFLEMMFHGYFEYQKVLLSSSSFF